MIASTDRDSDDAELYERCREGDREAWTVVWNKILRVCRWSRWELGDRAEDLASTIVLGLIDGGLEKLRDPAAFSAFLRRVAANRILDHLRPARPTPTSLDDFRGSKDEFAASPQREVIDKSSVRAVMQAIDRLGEPCRRLLHVYLAYRVGIVESFKEIEKILGAKGGTLSVQFRRCLQRLRRDPRIIELAP